jgi:choline transport protein
MYVSPTPNLLNRTAFLLTSQQISPTLRIPLNAIALVVIVVVLLTLITVGNTTAFFAILSLNTLALYLSYLMPMLFFTMAKLRSAHIPYGPFRLGRFGLVINAFAIVYAVFIIIFLPFPPLLPVTGKNMNYAGPIMGGVILFAIADYVVGGRKRFHVSVDREEIEATDMEETNGAVTGL